jgi:glycosyltransferase involved in cell wall biosynthesis
MPSFSIITPTLNEGQFLARAIQSVSRQDSPHIDHIVIDGGSSDNTPDVLRQHSSKLRWISEPYQNQAAAVNKGLRLATGEIIGWLNADDMYFRGAIDRVGKFFTAHADIDVVYGHAAFVDEKDGVLREFRAKSWRTRRLQKKCFFSPPSVFFRRRVVERCGFLDERWPFWADYEFWLRLEAAGCRFALVPARLAGFRVHPHNKRLRNPSPENRLQAAIEINDMLREKLGTVPARWILHYGRTMTEVQGLNFDDPEYDRSVLAHALGADRQWNRSAQGPERSRLSLLSVHCLKELEFLVRHPSRVIRLLPRPVSQFVRSHLKRKIFKLRHHEPRTMVLPAEYSRTSAGPDAPVISLVTPSLNQAQYLHETIESVLQQSYPRLEYIVQDGGSTDNTVEVLRRYADRLHHWESAPDHGQAHAINLGLERSTGEIMAYLNSDDLLLPGSLAYVAQYFQQHPSVDVVYGHRILIDISGAEIGRWVLPPHDDHVLPFADYIPQETMFWRRRAWERVGGYVDESFQFALDWDLILRFRDAGLRFVRLPRFLGAFRVSNEQKTVRLIQTVGEQEMRRLRRRVFGREPSRREIRSALRPYFRRQWLVDKMYLLGLTSY